MIIPFGTVLDVSEKLMDLLPFSCRKAQTGLVRETGVRGSQSEPDAQEVPPPPPPLLTDCLRHTPLQWLTSPALLHPVPGSAPGRGGRSACSSALETEKE